MHLCVGNLTIIGSDNGLSPGRRQAIIWTNAGILFIGLSGTNFSEILIEILTFSFKKMCLKLSSAKWRPFCLSLNVLTHWSQGIHGVFLALTHWNAFTSPYQSESEPPMMFSITSATFYFNHQRVQQKTKGLGCRWDPFSLFRSLCGLINSSPLSLHLEFLSPFWTLWRLYWAKQYTIIKTLRLRQNGRHFADDILKCIFLMKMYGLWLTHWGRDKMAAFSQTTLSNAFSRMEILEFSTKNSLKFVPKDLINNIPALVLIMAWRRPGDKPLAEPMLVRSLTHICATRPQWVKSSLEFVVKGPINNIPTLVQIMAWRWPGAKPLSERMMAQVTDLYIITPYSWGFFCFVFQQLALHLILMT